MPSIQIGNIFSSVHLSDSPWIFPQLTSGNIASQRMYVTTENVNPNELETFKLFLKELGVPLESLNNFGVASYKNGVFAGHSPAFFGLKEGQPGLVLGTANSTGDYSDLFIPCEVVEEERQEGRKKVMKWCYYLNETELFIEEKLTPDNKPTGKHFLKIKTQTPDLVDVEFSFPFLIDKKREFAGNEVNLLFKTGKFAEVCREFGTGSSKVWIQSNKAFTKLFEAKKFPSEGILILAQNGITKVTPAGSHPNITSDIDQSDWEIVSVSHPDLLIDYEVKKEWFQAALADVTNIQFTSAERNNEGYTWLNQRVGREGQYDGLVLLHIVKPSGLNVKHTPVNTVTNILPLMKVKAARYPEMQKFINEGANTYTPIMIESAPSDFTADNLYQPMPDTIRTPETVEVPTPEMKEQFAAKMQRIEEETENDEDDSVTNFF